MSDHNVPLLNTETLEALCEQRSTPDLRYWVEKETRSRVWIGVQNGKGAMFGVFPSFPLGWDQPGPQLVALHCMRMLDAEHSPLDNSFVEYFNHLMEEMG